MQRGANMINKNSNLEKKQYFWLLKIIVLFWLSFTFVFTMKAYAAAPRWQDIPGNTYKNENGTYTVLSGHLDKPGYSSATENKVSIYYYPWADATNATLIISPGVRMSDKYCLYYSIGREYPVKKIIINSTNFADLGTYTEKRVTYRNYYYIRATAYASPQYLDIVQYFFGETLYDKKKNPYFAGTTVYISEEENVFGTIRWKIDTNTKTLIISGSGGIPDYSSPWASFLQNHPDKVDNISIGDGIVSIGANAFVSASNVKNIMIGSEVKYIGANAFNCANVESIFNAGTTNQSLGWNAFPNITNRARVTYTKANINFINHVNGRAGEYITANAKGYVEIANGNDWSKYVMAGSGFGRYEIIKDFSFKGRVSIPATLVNVYDSARGNSKNGKKESSYYKVSGYKVYDNYLLKPMNETYREWPLCNENFEITGQVYAELLNLYGELNGNGHTITDVNYGLFNNNYGTIRNLVVRNSENQWPAIIGDKWSKYTDTASTYYRSPDNIGSIASINYGTIDSVDIEGTLSGSRTINVKYRDDGDYSIKKQDAGFLAGGIVGVNAATGVINKSHVTSYIRGKSVGGVAYTNNGIIYGCSVEGQIYGEAYDHTSRTKSRTSINQDSVIGGICAINNGTVEQSYGAAQILGYSYDYRNPNDDDEPDNDDVLNDVVTRAAALIVTNNGVAKSNSTGGYLTLANSTYVATDYRGDWTVFYTHLTTDFARFILENKGTVDQSFAGAGFRYTRGSGNPSQVTYNFTTSAYGANYNLYSLQNEVNIPEYNSGYYPNGRSYGYATHSCQITVEDSISGGARQYSDVDYGRSSYQYSHYVMHNHDNGNAGTRINSAQAKGDNASAYMPGLIKSNWSFATGKYPRPKDSLKIHVTNVVGTYTGTAIEGTTLDKSKILFTVYYSDGSVYKSYGNSNDFVYPYGLYIANVGSENTIYFRYLDNRLTGAVWPESEYGSFAINARERLPVDIIKVEYSGANLTENMNFNLSDVRVTVLYDNGSRSTYLGSSKNVGITTQNNTLGDLDGNGVINLNDYTLLRQALTSGTSTLTSGQRLEADINRDGKISTNDLSELSSILSRKVPFDRKTFYVKFSGINNSKTLTITSAKRKINGLSISANPEKLKYIEGEDFESKGVVVLVKYDNGESKTFYFEKGLESFDGLSLGSIDYPIENLIKGQDRIPITYKENGSSATVWLKVSVRQVYLTSIAITKEPKTKVYYSGESFDSKGMKVTAYYDEGIYADEREDNYSKKEEVSLNKCIVTGGSKLLDSTALLLLKADSITNENRDTKGFVKIFKNAITSPALESLITGSHNTIYYSQDTKDKVLTGTIVGNNHITVSYTENGITRTAIQPITVEKKKLTKIESYQYPHKANYVEGDMFDASGLIIKAYFTDGSSEFVYIKNDSNINGYEVINGDKPLPIISSLTVKYTKDGTSAITTIPITVTRNDIESISASYTGPKVDLGEKFSLNLVLINVVYKNGSVESFYADKLIDGNPVVDIYKKGTNNKDYQLHDSGDNVENVNGEYINYYTAHYAGLEAEFAITGIKAFSPIDFTNSVAQGRRDASEWTESFRGVKMKAVYDYINEYAKTGDSGLNNIEGKDGDGMKAGTQINPLQWFEREGDWVEPVTNFIIEYKARTNGFLFPETGANSDGSIKYDTPEKMNADYEDQPYLRLFEQKRDLLRNPISELYHNAGWSDWVRNGDSVGTSNAKRIAYDYTYLNPDARSKTTYIGKAKFRLNTLNGYTFNADENPQILIYVNGSDENPYVVTKNKEVEISDIQTMKIVLDGKIRVRNNTGKEELKDFNEIYKVGYKLGTANEPYEWKNGWVGTSGIMAECFEVKIQLATAPVDDFSFVTTPYVVTEPEDVSAVLGSNAVFTLKAVGQNLTYQWYRIEALDKGNMSKAIKLLGATKFYYEIPKVMLPDDGTTYYCEVKNGAGTTTTSQAMLSVVDKLPEITANLEDISINILEQFTFSIAATCQNPSTLKYQWEMTNKKGEWEVVKPLSTDNTYTITASVETHNQYIRCKITNTRGSVYSNPARIATKINPEVSIKASKTYANLSEPIIFTSYVTSYAGVPEYSWYVKDLSDPDAAYTLQNATSKTFEYKNNIAGEYRIKCIIKDENGYSEDLNEINSIEKDNTSISIKIGNPPALNSIKYSVVKTGTATETIGTINKYKATFTTNVKTSAYTKNNVSYQWYKNGQIIKGESSSTLTLTGLNENTQMTILCKVVDMFGSDYLPVDLNIQPATDIIIK